MSSYILSCGSICDLNNQLLKELDVNYLPYHFYLNDKEYKDDLGLSISSEDFYNKLKEGANPRTSQITINEYTLFFEQFLKEGKDIIHIAFSSGLSGSFNCALLAKNALEKKFPERIFLFHRWAACSISDWISDTEQGDKISQ